MGGFEKICKILGNLKGYAPVRTAYDQKDLRTHKLTCLADPKALNKQEVKAKMNL